VSAAFVIALTVLTQAQALPRLAGQPLAEALRIIEARGLRIVFTDDLVRPGMRVREEPAATTLRDIVDEILRPHGLTTRAREDGVLVVVLRFDTAVDVAAPDAEPPRVHTSIEVPAIQARQTAGGLENIFHTLQLLPGVTATSEYGSRQSVRGGGPDENLIVMDDIELRNPYRLFGIASGINPDTVEHFDLYAGAFSAKYGDRLSSLLQIDTRDGRSDKAIRGSANVSLTDMNVVFEGRLPGGHRGSWLVTTRRTYYDLLIGRVSSEIRRFPMFADGQAKVVWEPAPRWKVVAHVLVSHENTDARPDSTGSRSDDDVEDSLTAKTRTALFAVTLDRALARQARLRSTFSVSGLTDAFDLKSKSCVDVNRPNIRGVFDFCAHPPVIGHEMRARDWTLRESYRSPLGSRHTIDAGVQARASRSQLSVSAAGDDFPAVSLPGLGMLGFGSLPWHVENTAFESTVDGDTASAWVEDHFQPTTAIRLVPGLRLDHLTATSETLVSPRMAATLALGDATRLTASAGVHYQSPGYDKAFLGGEAFAVDFSSPAAQGLRSERAVQAVAGIERDLPRGLSVRVEGYARRLDRLIVGRLETEDERARRVATYDPDRLDQLGLPREIPVDPLITYVPSNDASGHVNGLEVFLARKPGAATRLTGWVSYTLSKADRRAYGLVYPFAYDRPHAAAAVAQYRVLPRMTASASFQMASGFPATLPAGTRLAWATNGDVHYPLFAESQPVYTLDYGSMTRLNAVRLPASSRLDVRVTWGSETGSGHWTYYVDVINVLNTRNKTAVFSELGYNSAGPRPIIINQYGGGFPIVPTAGVRWRF
jgi:TonB dependent receptor-like, beta-barrel/TonB-dependent Receptor Plug Domain